MAVEIELKLTLSPATARAFPQHPLLADAATARQHLLNTYYDTPDLALKSQRVALRLRKKGWQWLLTVKSAEPAAGGLARRNEWERPETPGNWDFSHVDADDLRARLEAATPLLEPIFTTDFRRRTWIVDHGASHIEIALDRGFIASQGRRTPICEVELELLDGQPEDLFALTRDLQASLALRPSPMSKAERGYALFAAEAPRPFKARPQPLDRSQTPVQAFRSIALGCLEHLQRNETGAIASTDPEYVHQARVALRRLRSAIKLFAPVLPPDFVHAYGRAWQSLAAALGAARNWDVFVSETLPPLQAAFPQDAMGRRLLAAGRKRSREAHRTVSYLLQMPEYAGLLIEFTAALLMLPETPVGTLEDFARAQLAARARRARKLAARHATLDPAERHRLRISCKKLRYALEFFSSLLTGRRVRPYLAALAQLQDELGLINDHVTAAELLAECLHGRPPGVIHGWIAGRHALLIAELPEALSTWMAQPVPWKRS